ncbi:prolyl oligopeptidase family serine peptidase [Paraglaciecola aestuariivivens]
MFKLNNKNLMLVSISAIFISCSATQTANQAPAKVLEPAISMATLSNQDKTNVTQGLTLEQIMADPDWIGRQPMSAYWADDGSRVFYQQKREGSPVKDLWTKPLDQAGNGEQVALEQLHLHAYEKRVLNNRKDKAAWVFEGNIFVKDLSTNKVKQLTKDNRQPHNLKFLLDGRISFQSGDALYAIHPEQGMYEQLASWKFAEQPKAVDEPKDYIAEQQQNLIQVVALKRQQKAQQFNHAKQIQAKNPSVAPNEFYFPKGHETVAVSLSPNGKWLVLAEKAERASRDDSDIMPNYINEDGRISAEKVRQRVADAKPVKHNLWLVNLEQQTQESLSYNSLPGYNEDVLQAVKRENAELKGEKYQVNRLPRDIHLMSDWYWSQNSIVWHNQGEQVAIMLEAWDNKDRWIATVDIQDAKLVSQHRLHDDAWVNYKFNSFGWLQQTQELYYLSEQSGYSHLYVKPLNGAERAITQGQFEVNELTLSADEQQMYFKANKKHPGIYEIYRVDLKTNRIEALTELNGMTDYQLSPDETLLLLTHSTLVQPPELFVQTIGENEAKQITYTVSPEFLAIDWQAPDIVPIKSSFASQPIFSRVYSPSPELGAGKRKAVVFNHGAGYLQNSHLGWSGYFREFMFHNFLVQQGYVVLDMDYRASAGYGRDWRTAIYRQMGTPEVQDLKDGVNWLVENLDVDAAKVGTYGGSYGGFLTFMSMFNAPDLFKAGAALRPVSDWAHYNHGYTSNILNTPEVDPIAYERSSPIYFAEGLENPLLMNAPMVDNNVFFVDVVRLVQRLIELEKQDFETAIYPVEAHGFVQPSSWLDEYRRIYKLFETNL